MSNLAEEKIYTYKDYIKWSDEINCDLIDGIGYPRHKRKGIEEMLKGLLDYIDMFRDKGIEDEKIEEIIIDYIGALIHKEVHELLVLNLNKLKYDRCEPQGDYDKSKMITSELSSKEIVEIMIKIQDELENDSH